MLLNYVNVDTVRMLCQSELSVCAQLDTTPVVSLTTMTAV